MARQTITVKFKIVADDEDDAWQALELALAYGDTDDRIQSTELVQGGVTRRKPRSWIEHSTGKSLEELM